MASASLNFNTPLHFLSPQDTALSQYRGFAEDLLALFRLLKARPDCVSDGSLKQTFPLRAALQAIAVSIQRAPANEVTTDAHCKLLIAILVHFIAPSNHAAQDKSIEAEHMTAFALTLGEVSPMRAPSFTFGYVRILCNPVFIPSLLKRSRGWSLLSRLLLPLLKFLGILQIHCPSLPQFHLLNTATLRLFLIIIHDFPAFLSEYCFVLCEVLPPECAQIRNLILSAFPSAQTLPDPHRSDLTKSAAKPEWLQETPALHDWTQVLFTAGVFDLMKDYYIHNDDSKLELILKELYLSRNKNNMIRKEIYLSRSKYNRPLISAIVLDVIASTDSHMLTLDWSDFLVQAGKDRGIQLIAYLMENVDSEGQAIFFHCICDHLRYPNPHTLLAARLLNYMGKATEQRRKLIEKIIEDRTNVHRPHPWGLLAAKLSFQNTAAN
eukprot:Gregarina_sp_Pseudo_9__4296@NODE_444_length_2817_cov_10_369690_g420_i0_p2_GENE_NODE_444_length_2817_cov_10_369690_g420_i0NODE_444_length_2817_cov_10_369690_g420_i0_p2_ORF_typecomplete_len437_score66_71Not1/PF04054_15/6_8e69_NODE_444_length_2817_cov_10_369690_g420_i01011411